MIPRTVLNLINTYLHKKRAIIIYGARRTGKTTILNAIAESIENYLYVNCDLIDGQNLFDFKNQEQIKLSFSRYNYLLIDEAQRVLDIGIKLKSIIDTLPDLQLIVTGSSALELSNQTNEPLTGRKFEFLVPPLSTKEIYLNDGITSVKGGLEQRLIFGNYPEVYLEKSLSVDIIKEIAGSYLFKDLLIYQDIKRPDLMKKILVALALQLGSEVSLTELAGLVGMDRKTVDKYISLLEQSFVIYRLNSFSRNLRNELKKATKVYFWDNGIRNALINNFTGINARSDVGALWENYFITERRKHLLYQRSSYEQYFWRTTTQQEIDLIEIENGNMRAFEIKWSPKKMVKFPSTFCKEYQDVETNVVNKENYLDFLLVE